MTEFDLACTYQFVLFLEGDADWAKAAELGELISRKGDQAPSLGLRLGRPQAATAILNMGPMAVPGQQMIWQTGGVWRLTLQPSRLDLFFDARAYSDLFDQGAVSLEQVCQRVVPNLAGVGELLQCNVLRAAMVFTGHASCEGREASSIVARIFFNSNLQSEVTNGGIADVAARVNHLASWKLSDLSDVRIHQIEAANVNWALREDGDEEMSLVWQLDVNTSVKNRVLTLSNEAVSSFYDQARNWISGQINRLRETP